MKPLAIFKAALSGRYYASRAYKPAGHNSLNFVVTGKKEDVTDQIEGIVAERTAQLQAKLDRAVEALGNTTKESETDE